MGKPSPPAKKDVDISKSKDDSADTSQKPKDKKKLMDELFGDDSPGKATSAEASESPGVAAPRRDKKKLMSELFGDDGDASKPSVSPGKATQRPVSGRTETSRRKKSTDDSMFDDDGGDLLGDIGDMQKRPSTSPKGGGSFLDSLLSKSPLDKPRGKKPSDFVLDDKYKNINKQEAPSSGGFQGYTPSASKSSSPRRRTPSKSPAKDSMDFDFLSDAEPRKRGSRSAPQRKPFEVDDDDILGNVRSHRRGNKEISGDPSPNKRVSSAPGAQKESSRPGRKDDWLFGDSGEASEAVKKNIEESTVTASVEKPVAASQKSPGQDQDWLGSLLSSNKKSPVAAEQQQVQSSPADPGTASQASQLPATNPTPPTPATASGLPQGAGVAFSSRAAPLTPAAAATYTPAPLHAPVEGMQNSPQVMLLMQQQQEAQAAVLAAQVKSQQEQLSSQMAQQLQQQQQMMAELLRTQQEAANKRYQEAVSTMGQFAMVPPAAPQGDTATATEQQKNIEVNLKEAETEAAKAKAELDLLRKQHAQEVALLEESHRRQLEVERGVWGRVEARLREERDSLLSDFQSKLSLLQEEKKSLSTSYQGQLVAVKEEWSQAVERTRELYTGMLDRVREEHSATLERVSHLKDLELKAAVAASGHAKEVEVVMTQLETNTSELTELTASINTRHDSALELTQRALKMKEKQLQDFEGQLAASRAEAENERGRLNTLIHRLENTLLQQGSEVEKERWRLAQERMKVEIERQAMMEERKHLQLSTETERMNLAKARENLLSEHRTLLQSVAQQKQELTNAQADLSRHQTLPYLSAAGTSFSKMTMLGRDAEASLASEEQRRLREKMTAVTLQQQRLKEEEARLNELNLQLEEERMKVNLEREGNAKESAMLEKTRRDSEAAREEIKTLRFEQQERLSQIAAQTRVLHTQQDKIDKEHLRLQQLREEVVHLAQAGVCAVCQRRGGAQLLLEPPAGGRRLPGDGGEGHAPSVSRLGELTNSVDRSPASVLARLAAARGTGEQGEGEKGS
ncbi:fas-binding factor 1 homolog isoform X2 [Scylla paramamosain]|uniref:fas-binding factor 1 homolog isoform X2 n=1 Tax=Scylla paramamosain TaxID=85552 RepID=UPI00308355C8